MIIINRWQDRYAEYGRYIDHDSCAVTYVSTHVGLASVPDTAAAAVVVKRTDDMAEVRSAAFDLVDDFGPPKAVVALKEDDLLVGAQLREQWGCPGPRTDDLRPFRDKYVTCSMASRAGLPVPAFARVSSAADVRAFGADTGWPVVVKPRISSSSEGVLILGGPAEADEVDFADGRPRLAQIFDSRPIYHVDGLFAGGRLAAWKASRYLNSCLAFRGGSVLGSVEEDDPVIVAAIGPFVEATLRTLTRGPVVFHFELFTANGECALLEVGARVGGAEIAPLWREVHHLDLMRAAFDIQIGHSPRVAVDRDSSRVGGWLLVPAPCNRPCRITRATSMLERDRGPYAEVIPQPGTVVPAADSYYEHVGGRFRFAAATTDDVESAIQATAANFRVDAVALNLTAVEAGP